MKKVIKPAEREEAIYFSDFSGKPLNECGPDVTLNLWFGYGSERDGAELELHLTDEDVKPIVALIKTKLSSDVKTQLKNKLEKAENDFHDSMQFRDWGSCDTTSNSIWLLQELLDIKVEE